LHYSESANPLTALQKRGDLSWGILKDKQMIRHLLLCAAVLIIFLIYQAPNAILNDLIMWSIGGLFFLPDKITSVENIFQIFQLLPILLLIPMVLLLATALLALTELEG
jgi:hypothetical protein